MNTVKLYKILDKTILFDSSSLKFIQLPESIIKEVEQMEEGEKLEYLNSLKSDSPIDIPTRKNYDYSKCDRVMLIFSKGCNMACKYCYEDFSDGFKTNNNMNYEEAKKAINFIASKYNSVRSFVFFGGEPLLNWKILDNVCQYILDTFSTNPPKLQLCTNGTIMNNEIIEICNRYNISVIISLDGTKEMHDLNRVFKDGNGTFNTIINNIEMLNKRRNFGLGIQASVSKSMFDSAREKKICLTEYFRTLGVDGLHLYPVSSCEPEESYDNVSDEEFESFFMNEMFVSIDSMITDNPLVIAKLSDVFIKLKGHYKSEINCEISKGNQIICPNGDVWNCPMLLSKKEMKIGNINDTSTHDAITTSYKMIEDVTYEKMSKCQNCELKYICSICPAFNYTTTGSFTTPADVVCRFNKVVLKALLYKMSDFVKVPSNE